MSGEDNIKDENLRLILSSGQEEWLKKKIRESKGFVWAMLIIMFASLSWLTIVYEDAEFLDKQRECFTLSADAKNIQEMRDKYRAQGLRPCPPGWFIQEKIKLANFMKTVGQVSVFLSPLFVIASFLTLLRHLYLLWRYKGYRKDHRAFLARYNRI